ncbi:MAG: hypothetical protein JEY91_10565, partial [Spirochaetaceae bacterium]|nr:hypothetical protein [Spirochaetaceae bacterium]
MEQIIFKPETRPSFFKIASIAALVLLIPMTILFIADRTLPFSSPLLISFRKDPTGDQYITRQGSLITESGESLVFQSDSEIFLLYPQTDFQLKRVLLSRLKEGQNIHYTLNEGTLEINRDNALQKEHLKIETVLGEIILGQGRFKLTSGKQKIILICFEGQLNYISSDRSQTFVLSKNQILEVEKDERGLYQIKTETLNSDRIQKEKTHMPEFRRSEQQNEKKPIISEPIEPKDDPLSEAVPEEMRSEEINQKKPEE